MLRCIVGRQLSAAAVSGFTALVRTFILSHFLFFSFFFLLLLPCSALVCFACSAVFIGLGRRGRGFFVFAGSGLCHCSAEEEEEEEKDALSGDADLKAACVFKIKECV